MLKKTVYIAEKPDIGRAVAAYLWPDGGMEKGKGCFRKGILPLHGHSGISLAWRRPSFTEKNIRCGATIPSCRALGL